MKTEIPLTQPMAALLNHARGLVFHEREIERVTASRFNVFQIIGAGHYEVSTHSALLSTLLDIRGSHGQGALFLKCFIETDIIRKAPGFPAEFDPESATVQCEVGIGTKTKSTGGRLDILIADKKGRKIAIENKINAAEQDNWVERYLHFLGNDGCLIYLTLFGDSPSQIKDENKGKVHCISYATTIKEWLEACRKEAATVPIVRESLTQYIHLIQELTHQNRDNHMNADLVESVLLNSDNFEAYCALRDADRGIRGEIVRKFGERIKQRISAGFEWISSPSGNCEAKDGFYLSTAFLNACNIKIAVSFDSDAYKNCFYGFELIDPSKPFDRNPGDQARLAKCFKDIFNVDPNSSGCWPAWKYWQPQHWDDEVLRNIEFDSSHFEEKFLSLVRDLLAVAQGFAGEPQLSDIQQAT